MPVRLVPFAYRPGTFDLVVDDTHCWRAPASWWRAQTRESLAALDPDDLGASVTKVLAAIEQVLPCDLAQVVCELCRAADLPADNHYAHDLVRLKGWVEAQRKASGMTLSDKQDLGAFRTKAAAVRKQLEPSDYEAPDATIVGTLHHWIGTLLGKQPATEANIEQLELALSSLRTQVEKTPRDAWRTAADGDGPTVAALYEARERLQVHEAEAAALRRRLQEELARANEYDAIVAVLADKDTGEIRNAKGDRVSAVDAVRELSHAMHWEPLLRESLERVLQAVTGKADVSSMVGEIGTPGFDGLVDNLASERVLVEMGKGDYEALEDRHAHELRLQINIRQEVAEALGLDRMASFEDIVRRARVPDHWQGGWCAWAVDQFVKLARYLDKRLDKHWLVGGADGGWAQKGEGAADVAIRLLQASDGPQTSTNDEAASLRLRLREVCAAVLGIKVSEVDADPNVEAVIADVWKAPRRAVPEGLFGRLLADLGAEASRVLGAPPTDLVYSADPKDDTVIARLRECISDSEMVRKRGLQSITPMTPPPVTNAAEEIKRLRALVDRQGNELGELRKVTGGPTDLELRRMICQDLVWRGDMIARQEHQIESLRSDLRARDQMLSAARENGQARLREAQLAIQHDRERVDDVLSRVVSVENVQRMHDLLGEAMDADDHVTRLLSRYTALAGKTPDEVSTFDPTVVPTAPLDHSEERESNHTVPGRNNSESVESDLAETLRATRQDAAELETEVAHLEAELLSWRTWSIQQVASPGSEHLHASTSDAGLRAAIVNQREMREVSVAVCDRLCKVLGPDADAAAANELVQLAVIQIETLRPPTGETKAERDAAWQRYLVLRKQVRHAAEGDKDALVAEAMDLAARFGFTPPAD